MSLFDASLNCTFTGICITRFNTVVVGTGDDVITNLEALEIENVIEDTTFKLVVTKDRDAGVISNVLFAESGTNPTLVNVATPFTNGIDSVPLKL
jgi:hypothetical protein